MERIFSQLPASPRMRSPSSRSQLRRSSSDVREPSSRSMVMRPYVSLIAGTVTSIRPPPASRWCPQKHGGLRSEEHTSELQSLMRISYAVFCLKKKKIYYHIKTHVHDRLNMTTVEHT